MWHLWSSQRANRGRGGGGGGYTCSLQRTCTIGRVNISPFLKTQFKESCLCRPHVHVLESLYSHRLQCAPFSFANARTRGFGCIVKEKVLSTLCSAHGTSETGGPPSTFYRKPTINKTTESLCSGWVSRSFKQSNLTLFFFSARPCVYSNRHEWKRRRLHACWSKRKLRKKNSRQTYPRDGYLVNQRNTARKVSHATTRLQRPFKRNR